MLTNGEVRNSKSATTVFFEKKEVSKTLKKPAKRQREEDACEGVNATTMISPQSTGNANVHIAIGITDTRSKEKTALKLNNLNDKKARFESHKSFLTRCYEEKIIPNGLKIYVEPSIGNHDDDFLKKWFDILETCSFQLMEHTINFSKKTITNVSEEIETTHQDLSKKLDQNEKEEILSTLKKNDDVNRKHLQLRKQKKFNFLKYNPKSNNNERNEIDQLSNSKDSKVNKKSYAGVLKNKSKTDV